MHIEAMTAGDIEAHTQDIYGAGLSDTTVT